MQTGGVREQLSSPKLPFSGECPLCPSVSYAEGTSFSCEKKRKQKIRKPTRLERVSTQRNSVKRGLRLWKQQPKQSPPFGKISPTHQPASALQLIGLSPIRQAVPLLNQQGRAFTLFVSGSGLATREKSRPIDAVVPRQKRSYPDRHRNASASSLAG